MAAPIGNEFYLLQSKHGRDKIFSTPDDLWAAAQEYFQWCEDNPWEQQNWVGKDGDEVTKKLKIPYTLSGFCVFIGCDERTLRNYGSKEEYKAYFPVYTRIEQIIRTQKFVGASVGVFNHSIIARDLGLVEKSEANDKHDITIKVNRGDRHNTEPATPGATEGQE